MPLLPLRPLALVCSGALALAAAPADAQDKTVRVSMRNWAENVAVVTMWKLLLEEKGYSVEVTTADRAIAFQAVAAGDVDLDLESWLPKTDEALLSRFEGDVEVGDAWYEGARLGLVVPDYMGLESLRDLAGEGAPDTITGIEQGSALMGLTEDAVAAYGLEQELLASSEAGMMTALERAVRGEAPIVVTLWNPHWAFAEYALTYLDDPQGVFGEPETIHYLMNPDFPERFPRVHAWLEAWEMDDASLGSLMAELERSEEPEEGARRWIEANRDLVENWME